jgi:hypothetical protein
LDPSSGISPFPAIRMTPLDESCGHLMLGATTSASTSPARLFREVNFLTSNNSTPSVNQLLGANDSGVASIPTPTITATNSTFSPTDSPG